MHQWPWRTKNTIPCPSSLPVGYLQNKYKNNYCRPHCGFAGQHKIICEQNVGAPHKLLNRCNPGFWFFFFCFCFFLSPALLGIGWFGKFASRQ